MLILLLSCNPDPIEALPPATTSDTAETGQTEPPDDTAPPDDDSGKSADSGKTKTPQRPIVVVMIGDGMGTGQRDTASLYAHGETGKLFLEGLQSQATITTASLSGVTDSAASATAMATGQITWNGVIGLDRDLNEVETLVELAQAAGLSVGVVTTAEVTHATPAAFTAHDSSRYNGVGIADDQAALRPNVLLGGGAQHYLPKGPDSQRTDDGLITGLEASGCAVVYDRTALGEAAEAEGDCLFGLFAPGHLDYMVDLPEDTTQPTLSEMTAIALDRLDRDEDGFLLVIEGARIDMASHSNELERTIGETLEFDATVELVSGWLEAHDDTLLIVTADHETAGLQVLTEGAKGSPSEVTWRHLEHTNAAIALYAAGEGAEALDGQALHHPWVHAVVSAHIEDRAVLAPEIPLLPDGQLSDHRWRVSEQTLTTDFGVGYNRLDALTMDVGEDGLFIGVEGLMEWENNAVVVLIDHDPGAGTGTASLSGSFTDTDGTLDTILTNLPLTAPGVSGFGADLAVLTLGGAFSQYPSLKDTAGIRGTAESLGAPDDLWWLTAGVNFADGVRTTGGATPATDQGVEFFVPWASLYPADKGALPAGAAISIAAILVNSDGTAISNQALPPHSDTPEGSTVALPGVVYFQLDSDSDGLPDGDLTPEIRK